MADPKVLSEYNTSEFAGMAQPDSSDAAVPTTGEDVSPNDPDSRVLGSVFPSLEYKQPLKTTLSEAALPQSVSARDVYEARHRPLDGVE